MPDNTPTNYSDFSEKSAFTLAEQGSLELAELIGAADRLNAAGLKDHAIALYRMWLENTSSPLAYVACFNLGVTLAASCDYVQAEAMYHKALELNPNLIQARLNLGNSLEQQKREEEALEQWRVVVESKNIHLPENKPFFLHALNQLGRLLETKKQYQAALEMLEKSFSVDSTQRDVLIHLVHLKQKTCKWPIYKASKGMTTSNMIKFSSPLAILAISDDPSLQRSAACEFDEYKFPVTTTEALAPKLGYSHKKIRIGYLSSDFCLHAVSLLTVELLELHDRDQFEVYGFCWSREDGTALQKRVITALDHHIRIGGMSDREVADCIRSNEIDIMIDLQGLTSGARPLILSHRPATVQMTYLGFPGTTALPWIDYVIADKYLIPKELVPYHSEKPLYMPNCFQSSDSKREVGPIPARSDNNLPDNAFVFCSFNNNYKFTPELFATWMRILKRVPDSVLWLLADNEWSRDNLIQAAKKHGIKKDRLVFAPRVPPADYLARYQLADLFLDTFPFNGGTTANDALFMGLPLLTISGRTFASRMAGSLLTYLGLPELITTSLKNYEESAVRLAKKNSNLNALKNRLKESKASGPVFDIPRFVKEYEAKLSRVLRDVESKSVRSIEDTISSKDPGGITLQGKAGATHDSVSALRSTHANHHSSRSLLVQGWTGISHSYAMVNQYQLLALAKDRSIDLFQQEMPTVQNWNKSTNGAGFSDSELLTLSQIQRYSGEPVSTILRIHSPNSLENADARILTFLVTELGLSKNNFTSSASIKSYVENGNLVITPSHWSRERIIEFGFSTDSVFVVPHGVDSSKFFPVEDEIRKKSRDGLGFSDDDVVFLNVGAPIWNKGMDVLIQAFFNIRKRNKNARLLIKDQQSLYGLSAQNMIGDLVSAGKIEIDNESIASVKVLPSNLTIEQLRMLYGVADYYVSPYRAEGFNLPVIEAIACGTPVIATSGGSTDDFCDDDTTFKIPSIKHSNVMIQNTLVGAYLEPDLDSLVHIMESCVKNRVHDSIRFSFGRNDLLEKFTWGRAAKLISSLV
jgi:predicted O-linked N-acetylglucosamine transferase (SPINDLY family)